MTPQEFLEFLRQHDVTAVGDLSEPPFELVTEGAVTATFQSHDEVVDWVQLEDVELRAWELRHRLVDE